jgi:hypothetical protein
VKRQKSKDKRERAKVKTSKWRGEYAKNSTAEGAELRLVEVLLVTQRCAEKKVKRQKYKLISGEVVCENITAEGL